MSDQTRPTSNNQTGARRAVTAVFVIAAFFSCLSIFESSTERAITMQLGTIGLGINLIAARYYWRG